MRFSISHATFPSFILSFFLVITCFHPLRSYIALNKTNLENFRAINTHQILNISAYQKLLHSRPGDPQIQWRLGAFLAKSGKLDEAVDILLPLLLSQPIDRTMLRSVLSTVINADRSENALDVYDVLLRDSTLLPQFTAYVALQYLKRDNELPIEQPQSVSMLTDALGLSAHSPEYELLMSKLRSDNFWSSTDGKQLRSVLKWKIQIDDRFNYHPSIVLKDPEQLQNSIATILQIPEELVSLGPELSVNGGFEYREICSNATSYLYCCCSTNWSLSFMSTGEVWNRGLFFIGTDNENFLSGRHALRIDGVIVERKSGLEPARAGVWHQAIELEANSSYVISFFYQTHNVTSDTFATYLATVPVTFAPMERYLPPSPNKWQQVTIVLPDHAAQSVTIQPLLRLWDQGTVWIDNFSVRKLELRKTIFIPELIYHLH